MGYNPHQEGERREVLMKCSERNRYSKFAVAGLSLTLITPLLFASDSYILLLGFITPLAGLILSAIGVFDAQENGKNGTLLGAFGFTLAIPLNIFVFGMVSLLLNANH